MNVKIISPEKMIYNGNVQKVDLPGYEGRFQVLNNHAPLISVLTEGMIKIYEKGKMIDFKLNSGIVKVNENNILIMIS